MTTDTKEPTPKKIPDFATMLAQVELNPAALNAPPNPNMTRNESYSKLSIHRSLSNVSNALKARFTGPREEGDFTLGLTSKKNCKII